MTAEDSRTYLAWSDSLQRVLRARPEINAMICSKLSELYQCVKVIELDHLSPDGPLVP